MNPNEVQKAFAEYDRQVRINNSKLGSVLAIILMPAGVALDYFVYPDKVFYFLLLRFFCSFLVGIVWALFHTSFGKKHYRVLGMTWYMLPAFFIAWMIYESQDPISPYYAGLNIVLLGVGLILPWTYQENLLAGTLVMLMYIGACSLQHWILQKGYLFNNLYFLFLTALIVVTGSYFHSRLRFREFELRFELDQSKKVIEETNRKLVELDQVKSRFFANISHELRTPLTLLLVPLEAILHDKTRSFDSQVREWLETMRGNGMRLLKLINDLLDLVKLESGKMQVKRDAIELSEFVKGLTNSVQTVAHDKRLRLESDIAREIGTIIADRDKLEKVILNLLFNALKFTAAGGRITIRAAREGEDLVLQISDTGMGISEAQLPFIFDRFWQADTSARRKYQGTGIGLALVKELVEVQGGRVSAESEANKGTTMTVRIPYVKAPGDAPPPAKVEPGWAPVEMPSPAAAVGVPDTKTEEWLSNLYRRAELFPAMTSLQESIRPLETFGRSNRTRILIADDEPDMLRFLKSQLTPHFQVLEAVDGLEAIEKASQFLPEVILLDMMMPEKDGLQVCRELRERTPTQSIPIILLTARADEETKLAALSAGANDFLSKPFSTTELHIRIKNLVDSHFWQRKLARQNQILESTLEQLKETESQLVQSEKMASLGRMSAGIIHEINNPLNFAKTGLYTLKSKGKHLPQEQRPDFEEVIGDIEEGVNRVKNIVSDLRAFTHPNTEQVDAVQVDKMVTSALRFLSNELKESIQVQKSIPETQTVLMNPNKLVQVLVNLLQNAVDAVKKKKFNGEQATIWIEGREEASRSVLIIRDNGQGIASENLNKIFDPFFTTKDVGEGMGLGLSICYRIVHEYGGTISARSEPGKFCEFTLEFPAKV